MKKVIITQSNYIPWKGYFDAINTADEFIIFDDMQYTKRDWRNRNQIKIPTGTTWLTIPVEVKGKYFQKINETLISDPCWAKDHWAKIQNNYSRAPYFKEYKEIFENQYLSTKSKYLSQINHDFIVLICSILGINTKISWSSDFEMIEGKTERLVDLCKKVGASDYYSGPTAKGYIDDPLFRQEGINVHYFDYSGYPTYRQLYGEFNHYVSIIDLIFNEGPESIKFMNSFKLINSEPYEISDYR